VSAKHNGGPAFPFPAYIYPNGEINHGEGGMSLRDYFAAKAPAYSEEWFQGYCKNKGFRGELLARAAWNYAYADAMLAERAKAEGGAL